MFKAEAELMSASQRLQALKPTEMVSEYSEQDGFFSAGGDGLTWRLESEKTMKHLVTYVYIQIHTNTYKDVYTYKL